MSNRQSGDFVSGLQDAIRQNPVSAALVGMGILWMFTGGNRISAAAALLSPAARAAATGVGSGLQSSADAAGAAADGLRSAGSRVVDGVRDTVAGAAASVSETASQAYEAVRGVVSDSASTAKTPAVIQNGNGTGTGPGMAGVLQGNLKETFQRQPLLLGAIGLAVGAGMAAGLPTTQIESDFAGDTADRVTAQVKDFASEQVDRVTETAKRTFEAVKEEAATQGLTPAAAKEGAGVITEKMKTVAKAARKNS